MISEYLTAGIIIVIIIIGLYGFVRWTNNREAKKRAERQARLAQEKAEQETEFAKRKAELLIRYNDEEIVQKIMDKTLWKGATSEMVRDVLGEPIAVDEKVLKTKSKQIWKYDPIGRGQYATRITIENDVVVGWDVKRG